MGCTFCISKPEVQQDNYTRTTSAQNNHSMTKQDEILIKYGSTVLVNYGNLSDNYEIVKKIGSGTFGRVFEVLYRPLKQKRALKVVKKDTINYQDDQRVFLKEIEMLAQLDHPNIIKIYEYYVDELNYYIISEFAKGGELYEQIFKLKNFKESHAAIIMQQILSAVCYMHSKGIVHRDLKPENIMLESRNNGNLSIKIIDFGTSNYCNGEKKLSLKVGTPYYIAPEVLKGMYTDKCDIWSIGVIMYILLSGSPPFYGYDDRSILRKVKEGKYNLNIPEFENISQEAKDLISKMLTYNPDERITAKEALKHPWFQKFTRGSLPLKKKKDFDVHGLFDKLRKFSAKEKLQQAVIAFLVHHVGTSEMVHDLKEIFQALDTDKNGTLSYDELKEGFNKYYGKNKITDKEFDEIMKTIDKDKNQCIEYEEFLAATINLDKLLSDQYLKLVFDTYDIDGSKELSVDEIQRALGVVEGTESEGLIKQIMSEIDTDHDGLVSFDEFKKLMQKAINK